MKCVKCKMRVEKTDKFCPNCGEKIVSRNLNAYVNKKVIFVLVSFICLLGILFGSYCIFKHLNSPSYIATKYFETVIKNNPDDIYPYVKEYDDSPFVSKELLKEKMTKLGKIENYSIKDIKEEGNKILVEFEYDLDGEYATSYVELKKEKILKFFDSYEVVSGKLALNVTIRVLSDSKITIDDKDIKKYLKENDDDKYYDTYVIPAMINGSYKFDIILDNGFEMDKEITLTSNSTYTLSKINLDDEVTSSIEKDLKDDLNVLYKASIESKNYEELPEFKNDLSSLYRSIKRSMNSSSKSVKEIDFTNVEVKSSMFNDKGNLEVEVFADYDMKYMYYNSEKEVNVSDYMSLAVELDDELEIINIYTSYNEKGIAYE